MTVAPSVPVLAAGGFPNKLSVNATRNVAACAEADHVVCLKEEGHTGASDENNFNFFNKNFVM